MAVAIRPQRPPVEAQMVASLQTYNARMRRSRLIRALALAALITAALWMVAASLFYLGIAPPETAPAGIGVTLILLACALLAWLFYKPSIYETARMLDGRLDDRQRMLTSVELLAQSDDAEAPRLALLSEAQLASSARMLAASDPKELYPLRTPWHLLGLSGGLLLLALGLFTLRGVQSGFAPLQAGTLPPAQNGAVALVSPTAQSGLPGGAQQTAQPIAAGTPQSIGGGGVGDAQPTASDPAEQAAASQQAQQDLNRLAQALDGQSASQQASDSMRQGDYNKAGDQLSQLGQQNDQLSDAAKQGLSDALNQAAQDSSGTPDLQQNEKSAADALASGDYRSIAGAMKDLGQAVQNAGSAVVPQQQMAKDYPPPTPPDQNPPNSASGAQQQQGGQNSAGQQGQSSQQGGGSQQGQQGQGGQNGQNGSQGQNGGQSSASQDNEGQSKGGSPGDGTRVNGPKDDTPLNVQGNPFELEGKPDPNANKPGQQNDQPALSLDGNSAAGGATSAGQGSAVTAPGESNNPPVDRWPVVQRYFSPGK